MTNALITDIHTDTDLTPSTSTNVARFAAILGWSMFLLVPVLFCVALAQAVDGGPDDHSASIFVIALVFAAISFASAIVGAVWGRKAVRGACIVLLAVQVLPYTLRTGPLF